MDQTPRIGLSQPRVPTTEEVLCSGSYTDVAGKVTALAPGPRRAVSLPAQTLALSRATPDPWTGSLAKNAQFATYQAYKELRPSAEMTDSMAAVAGNQSPIQSPHTPLCALGASAGGVAALKSFFAHVKNDLGLAFVVVVHLAPDHPSALSEILASQTTMPVTQIDDTAKLKPNFVYIIPPNRELVVNGDDVIAREFTESRGRRFPIDMFFHSVAAGRGDGIAVLLSGSGSDGTLGARAVKEAGGVIFAQEPSEAEYSQMPESAIAAGVVDIVASIATLTESLAAVVRSKTASVREREEDAEQQLRQIVAFVRRRMGHDFSNYKRPTIMRRLARRMTVVRQESLDGYYRYLQSNKNEVQELFADLLISVTYFFRDPDAFAALDEKVIKPLFDRLDGKESIRIWVIGCATGEEAYSLGILLLEEAARRGIHPIMQIFASDVDDAALTTAREGRYPKSIESNVSQERLRRFFVHEDSFYRVNKELRDLILFAAHSALKDPPFSKIDLISCRNLLIYLQRELQRQLYALFHYALTPNGYIFLGSAETIDAAQSQFNPVDRDACIYVASGTSDKVAPVLPQLTSDLRSGEYRAPQSAQVERAISVKHAHGAALEGSAPPSVLVDSSFKILHLSANAGRFFRPLEGPFSAELPAQVRPELRVDLRLALQRALEKGESSLSVPIAVAFNGDPHLVALHVTPSSDGDQTVAGQALVLFMDLGKAPPIEDISEPEGGNRQEIKRLRQELAAAQDRLSAGQREYEQATQDLRAANEELQSINEEYRSTAEELETSKEELQSINEELQTVNGELKSKLEAISTAHNDFENLVEATEIGTLFLDADFKIRFLTARVHEYFNIRQSDIGRVISDFRHRLVYDGLEQDVAGVLKSLVPIEKNIKTTEGGWVSMQVRPYRTLDAQIDGVVVTFADITKLKLAEQALEGEKEFANKLIDSIRESLIVLGLDLSVHSANQTFYETFAVTPDETVGGKLFELGNGQWNIPALRQLLEEILPKQNSFDDFEVEHDFARIGRRTMLLNGRRVDHLNLILLAIRDTTGARQQEIRQQALIGELQHRVKNILGKVRAMAKQTRKSHREFDAFFAAFDGRLEALARAQDLLLATPSGGIDLKDIVHQELEAGGAEDEVNFSSDGPSVLLAPRDAQAMAMTVHELATNAAKYGALKAGRGRVEIRWCTHRVHGVDHLTFTWRERGVHIQDLTPRKSFGSEVIERSLPYMLGGTARLTFEGDGVDYRLEFPLPPVNTVKFDG